MSGGFGNGPFGAVPYGAAGAETIISGWEPFVGADIERLGSISFNVTNNAWPINVTVGVAFTTGEFESVWLDGKFTELYWRGSLCVPISNGFHFSLRRTRGWPGRIAAVDVHATDLAGGVVSGQSS